PRSTRAWRSYGTRAARVGRKPAIWLAGCVTTFFAARISRKASGRFRRSVRHAGFRWDRLQPVWSCTTRSWGQSTLAPFCGVECTLLLPRTSLVWLQSPEQDEVNVFAETKARRTAGLQILLRSHGTSLQWRRHRGYRRPQRLWQVEPERCHQLGARR